MRAPGQGPGGTSSPHPRRTTCCERGDRVPVDTALLPHLLRSWRTPGEGGCTAQQGLARLPTPQPSALRAGGLASYFTEDRVTVLRGGQPWHPAPHPPRGSAGSPVASPPSAWQRPPPQGRGSRSCPSLCCPHWPVTPTGMSRCWDDTLLFLNFHIPSSYSPTPFVCFLL